MSLTEKYILTQSDYRKIINSIKTKYNFDLSLFAYSITKRRIENYIEKYNITNLSLFLKLIEKENYFEQLWRYLAVPTTELFRDYEVWDKISKKILPKISNNNFFKIWIPCVTSDDELNSVLILLEEHSLLDYCSVTVSYELEYQKLLIKKTISNKKFKISKQNYIAYKGKDELEKHFKITQNSITLNEKYFRNVKFMKYSFSENKYLDEKFDFILFRNRMLNFSSLLKTMSLDIIYNALKVKGYLAIGLNETIKNKNYMNKFSTIEKELNIYQKKK